MFFVRDVRESIWLIAIYMKQWTPKAIRQPKWTAENIHPSILILRKQITKRNFIWGKLIFFNWNWNGPIDNRFGLFPINAIHALILWQTTTASVPFTRMHTSITTPHRHTHPPSRIICLLCPLYSPVHTIAISFNFTWLNYDRFAKTLNSIILYCRIYTNNEHKKKD